MADWTTRLYETADGERVVEGEIKALGPEGATKIIRAAKRLRDEGLSLGTPLVKQIEDHILGIAAGPVSRAVLRPYRPGVRISSGVP